MPPQVLDRGLDYLVPRTFLDGTVIIHQAWAEGEGERLGLEAEHRGFVRRTFRMFCGAIERGHWKS